MLANCTTNVCISSSIVFIFGGLGLVILLLWGGGKWGVLLLTCSFFQSEDDSKLSNQFCKDLKYLT